MNFRFINYYTNLKEIMMQLKPSFILTLLTSICVLTSVFSMPSPSTVIITFLTPFNHPLSKALVEIQLEKGNKILEFTDNTGKIVLYNISPGTRIKIKIIKWRDVPFNYYIDFVVQSQFIYRKKIIIKDIGVTFLKIVDIFGKPIKNVKVKIEKTDIVGFTDWRGIFRIELPNGVYNVTLYENKDKITTKVEVYKNSINDKTIVFSSLASYGDSVMNVGEIIGYTSLVFSILILIFALYIKISYKPQNIRN